jgi:hypothetical protein
MESEYISLFKGTEHVYWLIQIMKQLGLPLDYKPNIWCDNEAAVAIANGSELNFKRTRFMNIKYHWVREMVSKDEQNLVKVIYVNTKDNYADIFTKRLNAIRHRSLLECFAEPYSSVLGADWPDDNPENEEDSE